MQARNFRRLWWPCLGLLVAGSVTACNRAPSSPTLSELAPQVNAAIPAKWKGKITFVPGSVDADDHRYALLVPQGWVVSRAHEGTVVPPDNNIIDQSPVFGFNNEIELSSECVGNCAPGRDWRKVSDEHYFQAFRNGSILGTVISDEELPAGRLMIFQREPEKGTDVKVTPQNKQRLVSRAWWEKNGTSYHLCIATLSDVSYELASVMAAACMSARVTPLPAPATK